MVAPEYFVSAHTCWIHGKLSLKLTIELSRQWRLKTLSAQRPTRPGVDLIVSNNNNGTFSVLSYASTIRFKSGLADEKSHSVNVLQRTLAPDASIKVVISLLNPVNTNCTTGWNCFSLFRARMKSSLSFCDHFWVKSVNLENSSTAITKCSCSLLTASTNGLRLYTRSRMFFAHSKEYSVLSL